MPNGGPHFCANCRHFETATSGCLLREVAIDVPNHRWKTYEFPSGADYGRIHAECARDS